MLKNIIILPLLMTVLSSCTILAQGISGSQKIQINTWVDRSPNLIIPGENNKFVLDIAQENVLEFDVKVFGETVYAVYTTDREVQTVSYPAKDSVFLPADIKLLIASENKELHKFSAKEFHNGIDYSYCIATITAISPTPAPGTPITHTTNVGTTKNGRGALSKKGVWVRMFKGTLEGTTLKWEPVFISKEPMEIGKIAILPLKNEMATLLAVTDNSKVIVFNGVFDGIDDLHNPNKVPNIPKITENDLLRASYRNIDQMNTWVDGNKTYISLVADNHIITGYYLNRNWFLSIDSGYKFDVKNMQVKMGSQNAYGIWMNETQQELIVAIYQESADVSRRWLEIDKLASIKNPTLNITTYKNSVGVNEDIYIGTVNRSQDFFQLFEIKDLKTFYIGSIISGWNERYAITGNTDGHLLFVRSNFDQELIFAGLNAFEEWSPVQVGQPPDVRTHPDSRIETFFLNNKYSITVFKKEEGSIHFLAGIRR